MHCEDKRVWFDSPIRSQLRRSFVIVTGTLIVWSSASDFTSAQQERYKTITIPKKLQDRSELGTLKRKKNDVIRGGGGFSAAKPVIDEYYGMYFFAALTQPDYRGRLSAMRMDLAKDLMMATNAETHDYLRDLVFERTRSITTSSTFHPAVRYNCVLALGDLNQKEGVLKGGTSSPPIPYQKGLGELVKLLRNSKSNDAVRVACLLGISRHAEISGAAAAPQPYTDNIRNVLVNTMVGLVQSNAQSAGRSQEGHDWMRQLAVDILGYLRTPGPNDASVKTLLDLIADKDASQDLRCAAARAIGRLDLEKSQIQINAIASAIGELAVDCCDEEISELGKMVTQRGGRRRMSRSRMPRAEGPIGMGGDYERGMGGEFGPNMRDRNGNRNVKEEIVFTDERTVSARRRLIDRLTVILQSLKGEKRLRIVGLTKVPGGAEIVAPLIAQITAIIKESKDHETELMDFGKGITQAKKELAVAVAQIPRPSEPNEPAPPPTEEAPVETADASG